MAALDRVAPMHSMMPVMLPVAVPSHTATMTPRVSTIRAVSSSRVGVVFSMNTARMAVHTGMADLQAGLRNCSASVSGVMSHRLGKIRPASRACKLHGCGSEQPIQGSKPALQSNMANLQEGPHGCTMPCTQVDLAAGTESPRLLTLQADGSSCRGPALHA